MIRTNFIIVSLLLSVVCFCQDKSAFKEARKYYLEHALVKKGDVPTYFNYDRKTFKISVDDGFVIPILSVTFHYESKSKENIIFDCKESDCIFEKEHLHNIPTCSIAFYKKEECQEFIKLLTNLRFAAELKKSETK